MSTVAERELENFLDRLARNKPEDYGWYARLAARLSEYPSWVVASMAQYAPRYGRYTAKDGYVFAHLWAAICSGQILVAEIHVGHCPYPDRCTKENNEALQGLPAPFSAEFQGGYGAGCDGSLTWKGNIRMTQHFERGDALASREVLLPEDGGSASLEVGFQPAARTWIDELWPGGTLARWPYGFDSIYLFYPTKEFVTMSSLLCALHAVPVPPPPPTPQQ